MMLLGIETATTVCAAAVVRDEELLAEEFIDERNVHAEKLMGMIDAVFRRSGAALEATDGIAVSIGPGSFTGLRIGLSVAKGLAYAGGKPLVPVSTLEGMARKAADSSGGEGTTEWILPMLDARRGDVYCALYRIGQETLHQEWEERVMALGAVADALPPGSVTVTGDARHAFERLAQERVPELIGRLRVASDAVARCSAATIARIGRLRFARGESADPGLLEPHYLRDFYTTTHQ